MPREGTKTENNNTVQNVVHGLRLNMPREGTKTVLLCASARWSSIEIKYAPGGDENVQHDELSHTCKNTIEIKYAPGGDENYFIHLFAECYTVLRLNMPREGTKTSIQ